MNTSQQRIVGAEEARVVFERFSRFIDPSTSEQRAIDYAHTVIAQTEQIAAVLALCSEREALNFPQPMLTTEEVRRALGVTD